MELLDIICNLFFYNIGIGLSIYIIRRLNKLETLIKWKQFEKPQEIEVKKKRGRPKKEKNP